MTYYRFQCCFLLQDVLSSQHRPPPPVPDGIQSTGSSQQVKGGRGGEDSAKLPIKLSMMPPEKQIQARSLARLDAGIVIECTPPTLPKGTVGLINGANDEDLHIRQSLQCAAQRMRL